MADNRITLELTNAELEGAPIRLADLVDGLDAARRALVRIDELVEGLGSIAEAMDWRIIHLSYASPVRVTVEPIPLPGYERHSEAVVSRFFEYADKIQAGAHAEVDGRILRAFQDLSGPVDRGRIRIEIHNGSETFKVPRGMGYQIKAALAPETTALGSVKGQLEYINLHGSVSVFRIYPAVGPTHVECRFGKDLEPDATGAIGRNVRVHGKLHYRVIEDFPYRMQVREIEVLPHDSELPTLMDLKGMAPSATGDMASEDFVRSLRVAREEQRQA